MSWLSSFASGVAGKLLGSAIDVRSSKSIMAAQSNYSKELARYVNTNKHQWEVQDLKNAGLNPILSANSTGYASSSLSGSTLVSSGLDSGSSAAAVADKQSKLQNEIAKEQVKIGNRNADSQEKTADAAVTNSETQKAVGESTVKLNDSSVGVNEANKGVLEANKSYIGAQEEGYKQKVAQDIAESNARIENMILTREMLGEYYQGLVSAAFQQADAASRGADAAYFRAEEDARHNKVSEGQYDKLHVGDYSNSANQAAYRGTGFGQASGFVGSFLGDAGRLLSGFGFK